MSSPFRILKDVFSAVNGNIADIGSETELFDENDHCFFEGLQIISKWYVSRFKSKIASGMPLKDALIQIKFNGDFSYDHLDKLEHVVENGPMNNTHVVCLLYLAFAWVVHETERSEEDLVRLLTLMKYTTDSFFKDHVGAVFTIICFTISSEIDGRKYNECLVPILEYFAANDNLPPILFDILIRVIQKQLSRTNRTDNSINPMKILADLFMKDASVTKASDFTSLLTLLSYAVSDLNIESITVLCRCTFTEGIDDDMIANNFIMIPDCLFRMISEQEVMIPVDSIAQEIHDFSDNVADNPEVFMTPPAELFEKKCPREEMFGPAVDEKLKELLPEFSVIGVQSARVMVSTILELQKTVIDLPHYFDFVVCMLELCVSIADKIDFEELEPLLTNKKLFHPDQNVFSCVLSDKMTTLRNKIIDAAAEYAPALIEVLLSETSSTPFMFAELITRVMYCHPLKSTFYIRPRVMNALIEASLTVQQLVTQNQQGVAYSKSTIFNVLFGLLDETETANAAMENQIFAKGFISLMFSKNFTSVVVKSLSNCFLKIPALPSSVVSFLGNVFDSCSAQSSDPQLKQMAKDLSKALIKSLAHNIALAGAFDDVMDSILGFMRHNASDETLDAVLSILMYICQSRTVRKFGLFRFNAILDVITLVEGKEPSNNTLLKLQNMMNGSTNVPMNLSFLIKNSAVIPVMLCSVAGSQKLLAQVLGFFASLARQSDGNISSLHDGNVDLILIQAINGKAHYRGRDIVFDCDRAFVRQHILPLLITMISVRSSYSIDKKTFDLFTPDENGVFGEYAATVMEMVNTIFSSLKYTQAQYFPAVAHTPVLTCDLDSSKISNGFTLAMNVKIDGMKSRGLQSTFNILQLSDGCHTLNIWCTQGSLYARYEGNGLRTSTPIWRNVVLRGWKYIILEVKMLDEGDWILATNGGELGTEEIDFKQPVFENTVKMSCGFMNPEDPIVHADTLPIVVIGTMAIFSNNMPPGDRERINTGLGDIPTKYLIWDTFSPKIKVNPAFCRKPRDFMASTQAHVKIEDFYNIFYHMSNAPPKFAEQSIVTIGNCIDLDSLRVSDFIANISHTDLFHRYTKVDIDPEPANVTLSLSQLSVFPVMLLLRSQQSLTYPVYIAFYNMYEQIKSKWLKEELVNYIILNAWLWCSSGLQTFQRIMKHWLIVASRCSDVIMPNVLHTFLIQTHLLANKSSLDLGDFGTSRFKVLEELASGKNALNEKNVDVFVSLVYQVKDNKREVLSYLKVMHNLARVHQKVFDTESLISLIDVATDDQEIFEAILDVFQQVQGNSEKSRICHLCRKYFGSGGRAYNGNNIDVLCISALYYKPKSYEFIRTASICRRDKFGYMWPVMIGLTYKESHEAVLKYLSLETSWYHGILTLMDLLYGISYSTVHVLRDAFITKVIKMYPNRADIFIRCFISLHWRYKETSYSPAMMALFDEYGIEYEVPHEFPTPGIHYDQFTMDELQRTINQDLSQRTMIFERNNTTVVLDQFFLEPGNSAIMQVLMNYLSGVTECDFFHVFDVMESDNIYSCNMGIQIAIKQIRELMNEIRDPEYMNVIYNESVASEKSAFDMFIEKCLFEMSTSQTIITPKARFCPFHRFRQARKMKEWPAVPKRISTSSRIAHLKCRCLEEGGDECDLETYYYGIVVRRRAKKDLVLYTFVISCIMKMHNMMCIVLRDTNIIRFETTSGGVFIKMFNTLGIPCISEIDDLQVEMWKQWTDGNMPTFDYIHACHILDGKWIQNPDISFAFPAITSDGMPIMRTGSDPQKWFSGSPIIPEEQGEFPIQAHSELDFFTNEQIPDSAPWVYKNRISLESENVSRHMREWFGNTFGYTIGPKRVNIHITSEISARSTLRVTRKEVDAVCIIRKSNAVCVLTSDTVDIYRSTFTSPKDSDSALVKITSESVPPHSKNVKTIVGVNYALFIDMENLLAIRVSPSMSVTSVNFWHNITSISSFGENLVYVDDNHSIYTCKACDFPENRIFLFGIDDEIEDMVIHPLGCAVLRMSNSVIITISLLNGSIIGKITDFMGKTLNGLTISHTWRIIMFECDLVVYAVSPNGRILQMCEMFSPVSLIETFTLKNGADFAVIVDSRKTLYAHMLDMKSPLKTIGGLSANIMCVNYINQTIVVIGANGIMPLVDFPVIEYKTQ